MSRNPQDPKENLYYTQFNPFSQIKEVGNEKGNWLFSSIFFGIAIFHYILIEFTEKILKTIPLSWQEHLACLFIALLSIPWSFAVKAIFSEQKLSR
jgi:hypothetical protein